ncbi:unnamed protein product [Toxocara canis]|uniref:Uncharacterized protein n=1 Tax=Toxocara canis TaxID=6265 RepID=A0A183UQ88_TOXCA|nr:unnamed protein product [Toxocara canis]
MCKASEFESCKAEKRSVRMKNSFIGIKPTATALYGSAKWATSNESGMVRTKLADMKTSGWLRGATKVKKRINQVEIRKRRWKKLQGGHDDLAKEIEADL